MPRPKKQPLDLSQDILAVSTGSCPMAPTVQFEDTPQIRLAEPKKILAKAFHMVVGVDLIGAKTSLATSKNMELEVTPLGIKAYSKSSKRTVLIPWTNIKGAELL